MNTTEQKVYDLVSSFFWKDRNAVSNLLTVEEVEHVFQMGTSILMHKWQLVPYKAGGFVTAFLANDLETTFAKADMTNVKAIYFYLRLCANVECPKELLTTKKEQ